MHNRGREATKKRVAREAALLLYSSQEKEYKQAKRRAADTLGARILPSNREVAEELDKIADETEGLIRRERLIQMRKDALSVMVSLGKFQPKLVGSVWRGTAHRDSDIDIEAFSSDPKIVLESLRQAGLSTRRAEWQTVTKGDRKEKALHIYVALPNRNEVEVVVRDPEEMKETDKCEIYGDIIKGLNMHQLRKILTENPAARLLPP